MKNKILSILVVILFLSFDMKAQSITNGSQVILPDATNRTLVGEISPAVQITMSVSGWNDDGEIQVVSPDSRFKVCTTSGGTYLSQINFVVPNGSTTFSYYVKYYPTTISINVVCTLSVEEVNIWGLGPNTQPLKGRSKGPEIDVLGNEATTSIIGDGTNTPSYTDSTLYPSTGISSSVVRRFNIANILTGSSAGDLKLTGSSPYATISGANAADFSIVTPYASTPVSSAGSTDLYVRFTPSASGTRTATITISNNDPNEGTYTFNIQGTGAASLATVSSTTAVTGRTTSGGTSGGNITSNGGSSITARGVCWNTSTGPTTANSSSSDGTGTGSYSSTITGGLSSGTLYYVRAYATNTAGDAYGPEVTFYTLSTEPSANASAATIDSKTSSSINLSWTSGTGESGYIVLMKAGGTAPTTTGVVDGVKYTSFSLPGGTTVVGETTEPTHTITASGLAANTTYSFLVIAYAKGADDATYNYKIDNTTSVSATTVATAPTVQASNLVWGTASPTSIEFSWNTGNGAGDILLIKSGGTPANPTNGTTYTANSNYSSAPNLGDGTKVVFMGSGAKGNVVVTGLSAGVNYFFKVLSYNGGSGDASYNTTESSGFNAGNSDNSYLPISLLSFNAKIKNQMTLLEWVTGSEIDNDYFTIERTSNLLEWESIGDIKGAGNSNALLQYSIMDEKPLSGISYYRLKQTDFDGKFTYSDVISINNENGKSIENISISNGNLNVLVNSVSTSPFKAEVYSISGQLVYTAQFSSSSTDNTITIPLLGVKRGLYVLRISNSVSSTIKKFVY